MFGVGFYIPDQIPGSLDEDAVAYYEALKTANGGVDIDTAAVYGISLSAFKSSLSAFVKTLKAAGVWDISSRIYPMAGGTAATHAVEMKTATSILIYVGAPTHSGVGMTLNGSSQYADLVEAANGLAASNNDHHLGLYNTSVNDRVAFGDRSASGQSLWIRVNTNLEWISNYNNAGLGGLFYAPWTTENLNSVLFGSRRSNTDSELYADGSSLATTAVSNVGILPTVSLKLGEALGAYLQGDVKFASIGDSLTSVQVSAYTTAIKTLNVSLGRDYEFTDSDAAAYWSTLEVENGGQVDCATIYGKSPAVVMAAVDTLFTSLKTDGTFGQIANLFLFVGGTDATHAVNAISAASELTYTGSPTHDQTGMVLNGSTQFADLNSPPDLLTNSADDNHLAVWGDVSNDQISIGCRDAVGSSFWINTAGGGPQLTFVSCLNTVGSGRIQDTVNSTQLDQLIVGSRTSNTDIAIYVDGSVFASDNSNQGGVMPSTQPLYLGAYNLIGTAGSFVAGSIKFASVGDGLSSSQVSTLNSAIKTFNTALNR